MQFVQPYDGRHKPTIFTPEPIGYRVRKTPRAKKLWTFCENHHNAMVALNTLRAAGYRRAVIEPLYL
jgi:hypothetical protein